MNITQSHRLHSFGPREGQVAALLAIGASNPVIARELCMSLNTVKVHCNRLYLRYGLTGCKGKRIKFVTSILNDAPTSTPVYLSPLLIRICDLLVLGFTNREIAQRLGLTEGIIKEYLQRIYKATGSFSRLELAIYWKTHGIVQ